MIIKEKEVKVEDKYVRWFSDLSKKDVKLVGGKAANLGEMLKIGMPVPQGFVVIASAYESFLEETGLKEKIYKMLEIDVEDTKKLEEVAGEIRKLIENAEMPKDMEEEIIEAYEVLSFDEDLIKNATSDALNILKRGKEFTFVAVRSSATAEDSEKASFAGQQETFLNVKGKIELIESIKKCFASLFTARSIYYRVKKSFRHEDVLLAAVVQIMINSDKSGVIFSRDPVKNPENVIIEAVFGLGEGIVSGRIQPDHYVTSRELKIIEKKIADKKIALFRNSSGKTEIVKLTEERSNQQVLTDYEIKKLSGYALKLEEHYNLPQDIEFAISANEIFIVQTRPVTTLGKEVKAREVQGKEIVSGLAASPGIGFGEVKIILDLKDLDRIKKGNVLVTKMTNPDMVVSMQKSSGIVTDEGGVTSHAAIVSREMGIPCFSGDTLILADKGFMQLEEVEKRISSGEELYTLSFDIDNLRIEWKKIVNSSKRLAKTITVSVSKNGKVDWNTINTTPEHKFFSFEKRNPSYKEMAKIIEDDKMVYTAKKIPSFSVDNHGFDERKAYICGAIFSDGYMRIQPDGTSSTVFVQKTTPNKIAFINNVCKNFWEVYNYQLRLVKPNYYYCYRKNITRELMSMHINLDKIILGCNPTSIINFLSSIIDGDGNFIRRGGVIKISFDMKDIKLLHSFVIGCLRLGLNYRIRKENNEFRFYITSNLEMFKPRLKRVIIDKLTKATGNTYFSSKHLFSDIPVPGRRGIKSFVKDNCLLSEKEISMKIIPYIKNDLKEFLLKLIDSDIGVLRVKKISENEEVEVFNIEVEDNNNYVVFTKFFTPLIVKNCVVGTKNATEKLKDGQVVTVDGFKGKVYIGEIEELKAGEIEKVEIKPIIKTETKIKVIVDLPDFAERASKTNCKEVGLLRLEGIIAESGKHPFYFLNKPEDYEEIIFKGIKKISEYFDELWIRTSDIRSDEFRNLEGSRKEIELNPMLGMHGIRAGLKFREILIAELRAMKKLADNKIIGIMMPQIISVEEVREVKKLIKELNIKNIKLGVMIETPAAVQIIEELCKEGIKFISFGTNDLTQYTLAIDRGNEEVQYLYNEMHPAVLKQLANVISVCKKYEVETSICGQAGSDKKMVEFLVKEGIDSISVNADKAYEISKFVKELEEMGFRGESGEIEKEEKKQEKEIIENVGEEIKEKAEEVKDKQLLKKVGKTEEKVEEWQDVNFSTSEILGKEISDSRQKSTISEIDVFSNQQDFRGVGKREKEELKEEKKKEEKVEDKKSLYKEMSGEIILGEDDKIEEEEEEEEETEEVEENKKEKKKEKAGKIEKEEKDDEEEILDIF